MCAETPLTAGAAIHSAAGVRVEHGARPIIRFPVTGFLRGRSSDGCCRIPACRLLSPGFPPLVSRRRVLVVGRMLPGSCCRFLSPGFPPQVSCRWFSAAGFLSLSVCCRIPAVGFCRRVSCRRVLVVGRMLPGSCLSAFVAGFPAAGFPPQGSCSRAYAAGFWRWFSAVYFVAAGASAGRAWRDYAFRFVLRSRRIASKFSSAQPINDTRWGMSDSPRGVRVYSTRGGTSG